MKTMAKEELFDRRYGARAAAVKRAHGVAPGLAVIGARSEKDKKYMNAIVGDNDSLWSDDMSEMRPQKRHRDLGLGIFRVGFEEGVYGN